MKAADDATLQSVEQPDLSALMGKLDNVATGVENLTKSFSGEQIDKLLGPLTDLVKNNQSNLTATIANIKTITDRIAQGQGTVGKLINSDDALCDRPDHREQLARHRHRHQESGRSTRMPCWPTPTTWLPRSNPARAPWANSSMTKRSTTRPPGP